MNRHLYPRYGFRRYAFRIQYHGGSFVGFVKQKAEDGAHDFGSTRISVESCLERALASISGGDASRFENVQVSSRTDSGVHAWGNTLHVDLRPPRQQEVHGSTTWWDPLQLVRGINHHLVQGAIKPLPESVQPYHPSRRSRFEVSHEASRLRVLACRIAPLYMAQPYLQQGWNARFSATRRIYLYRILHGFDDDDAARPFEWDRSWRVQRELDLSAMKQAARHLVGTHDFTSFQSKGCQRSSPVVTLDTIDVSEQPFSPLFLPGAEGICVKGRRPMLLTIRFCGNAFLYRQVRNLTGCLVASGLGQITPDDVIAILHARDRTTPQTFTTAPPHGLYLYQVQHGDFEL
jgi:tRNA pseudouridine38-40 synthase